MNVTETESKFISTQVCKSFFLHAQKTPLETESKFISTQVCKSFFLHAQKTPLECDAGKSTELGNEHT